MDRRDLLKMIVAATGTAFIGTHALAYELTTATKLSATGFSVKDIALLNELGEVIIPKTDTPGAKQADVGSTIPIIVADCFAPDEQVTFRQGLVQVEALAKTDYAKSFMQLTDDQKLQMLNTLDEQAKLFNQKRTEGSVPHFFTLIKQQVLFCFFTSKVGATEALRFIAIPGRYDGEYPYKKGDKAWA
jgi:hypothetical protein